jgi:hypothetical protein
MARAVIRGVFKNRSIIGKPFLVFLPPIVKALFPPFVPDISLRLTGFNKALYSCKGFYKK